MQTYFRQVGAYVSLKQTNIGTGHFYHIWVKIKLEEKDLTNLLFSYWNGLPLGSVETYFVEVGAYISWKEAPEMPRRFVFAEFEWKYHCFWNKEARVWDLKNLLFRYWNDLILVSVEKYFLEVTACVSLQRATTALWEGCFCWMWLKISLFSKFKSGGVEPKSSICKLLTWASLRLSRNKYCGNRCIRVFETSHR